MVGDAGIEPATPPVCTGVGDRKVAEEIRAKRESDLIEQAVHGRRATATFAESALSYTATYWEREKLLPSALIWICLRA